MVLVKMLMKIGSPMMRGLFVMSITSIPPSWREVSPSESLNGRAKVLLPRFRLDTPTLHPKSPLLIFLGQNPSYSRRWAPKASYGTHKASERAWGGGHALVPYEQLVAPSSISLLQ